MKTASRQTRLQQKSNVRSQETCKFSKTPIAIVLIFAVNFVQQCLLLKLFFSPLVFRLFNHSCYFYISLLEFDAQFEIFDGKATCKRTEQLSTLLGQQCWELLGPCWQWCANACNNSQKWWDLHSTSWEGQIPSKDLGDHV